MNTIYNLLFIYLWYSKTKYLVNNFNQQNRLSKKSVKNYAHYYGILYRQYSLANRNIILVHAWLRTSECVTAASRNQKKQEVCKVKETSLFTADVSNFDDTYFWLLSLLRIQFCLTFIHEYEFVTNSSHRWIIKLLKNLWFVIIYFELKGIFFKNR